MENPLLSLWNKNKIILKAFLIGILMLLLLIPTNFIQSLVSERQQRRQQAVAEISSRWSGPQEITPPAIGIPYTETETIDNKTREEKKWAYFLPEKLKIQSTIVPEIRYRGIYQVIVYTTEIKINGTYDSLALKELNIDPGKIHWNEATLFFDLSDMHGLKEDVVFHVSNAQKAADVQLSSAKVSTQQFKTALSANLPADIAQNNTGIAFTANIKLKGSGSLEFIPTGRETNVEIASTWSNPSFSGSALPDLRTVKDSGFDATWKILSLNRKFPQQWKEGTYDLEASAFGVNLLVPVDVYQQTTRSVKYAILVILLTFTAFLLIEWIYSRPIHSLQYVLVGFALCIFYTLLLSFSEYLGFNAAYGIAAIATIGLIAWYVGSMLRSSKMSLFIAFLLAVQYGFVFTLIQLQDYALLMGSIGLFVTLGIVMYFSRKIKWE